MIVSGFALLVATGHGERCAHLREDLRELLLSFDRRAGMTKLEALRISRKDSVRYRSIMLELERLMSSALRGVPPRDIGTRPDKSRQTWCRRRDHSERRATPLRKLIVFAEQSPLNLDARDPEHASVFRHTLEWAMTHGLWSGIVHVG